MQSTAPSATPATVTNAAFCHPGPALTLDHAPVLSRSRSLRKAKRYGARTIATGVPLTRSGYPLARRDVPRITASYAPLAPQGAVAQLAGCHADGQPSQLTHDAVLRLERAVFPRISSQPSAPAVGTLLVRLLRQRCGFAVRRRRRECVHAARTGGSPQCGSGGCLRRLPPRRPRHQSRHGGIRHDVGRPSQRLEGASAAGYSSHPRRNPAEATRVPVLPQALRSSQHPQSAFPPSARHACITLTLTADAHELAHGRAPCVVRVRSVERRELTSSAAFKCNVSGCKRTFSVLSNKYRHERSHKAQNPDREE